MDVHSFSTGRVRNKRDERGARRYLPGGWSNETHPVNVFVVDHPDGLCVVDTGQTVSGAAPGILARLHPFLRLARFELGPEDEAGAQLTRLGFDPAQVRWVVLSHLHIDHVAGLNAFAHAEVLVSRVEWERARGLAGRLRGYVPGMWPSGIRPTLLELDRAPLGPFAASYDVSADGRLLVVPLPGHTPGHIGLLVRNGRSALLAGDAVSTPGEAESLDPRVARYCRDEGITLLGAHDPRALV